MKKIHKERLGRLGVAILYLFGSRAIQVESTQSDIDLGVVLKNSPGENDHRSLYHSLFELFSEIYPTHKVDIVLLQTTPITLQYSAVKDGRILFEVDPRFTSDFESMVINQNLDFQPVLAYFDRIASIRHGKSYSPAQ